MSGYDVVCGVLQHDLWCRGTGRQIKLLSALVSHSLVHTMAISRKRRTDYLGGQRSTARHATPTYNTTSKKRGNK